MDAPRADLSQWFATEVAPHEPALRAYLYGPVAHPRGLLFATARNAARDLSRRRAVTGPSIPIAELDGSCVFDGAPNAAETASRRQETDLRAAAERPRLPGPTAIAGDPGHRQPPVCPGPRLRPLRA